MSELTPEDRERIGRKIEKIGMFTRDQETLVRFYGKGVLGPIDRWQAYFTAEQCAQVAHPGAEYERLMKHYKLQGPFYVLELCQGTPEACGR